MIETMESFIPGEWLAVDQDQPRITGKGPTEAAALEDLAGQLELAARKAQLAAERLATAGSY